MNNKKQIGSKLIEHLERKLESKIVVYFTGDRQPFGSRIAEDAVRPLYEHLMSPAAEAFLKIVEAMNPGWKPEAVTP